MKAAVADRHAPRLYDIGLAALAALACLAVGKVLPGTLEGLAPSRLPLVPVVLLVGLFVIWLCVARPRAALILGFALLGIVRVEPAPVDAVFALLIAATFAVGHVRPRVPSFVAVPLALFALVTLISINSAPDLHRALKFEFITLYMLALAVWLSWAFVRRDWAHVAIKTYLVVAIVSGALGPIALYLPLPGSNTFLYFNTRAEGLFKDPNVYAAFLVPAAIILLEEVTAPRLLAWRRSRVIAAFGVVSIGVVVAYSRAAWLNFALAVAILVFIQATRHGGIKRAFKSIVLLGVSGLAGLAVLAATGSLTFLQQRSHLESYDTQRFSNQGSAFSDMTHHIFGYGPGQADVLLPLSTHSSFIRAAFEQGLLGVTFLVLVLLGTLICALILARRRLDVNGVGTAALLGIWVGQIANSFFIDTIHWRHIWIVAALIWCGYSMVVRHEEAPEPVPV